MHADMFAKICLVLIILLSFLTFQCETQKAPKKTKKPKPPKSPIPCPDTCALKRRIGKLELRFYGGLDKLNATCESKIQSLRAAVLARGAEPADPVSPMSDGVLDTLRSDILSVVDEKISSATDDITEQMEEQYDVLKRALRDVNEKSSALALSPRDDDSDSSDREQQLQNAVALMNLTVMTLMSQNANLMQQTEQIREQTAVLRAQNEALIEDNKVLRKLDRQQQLLNSDQDRVLELEDEMSVHETRLNTIDSQMEWLTSRINHLSDVADRSQTEAAEAAGKATRAMQMAKKAIAVARRQPAPTATRESPNQGLRQPEVPPIDCQELYRLGYNVSGVYRIKPWRSPEAFDVFCEQSYNGGGWTLIQRRRDGTVDFDRDWNEYSLGFGDLAGESWLGNQKIYFLTNQDTYSLQVLLLDWEGHRAYAEYEGFRIQSNSDTYALQFGRFTRGNAGDALRGRTEDRSRNAYLTSFTTRDSDNDACSPCFVDRDAFDNCAELQGGGWWFRACSDSNLNGRYIQPQDFSACGDEGCYGIQWRTWRGDPNYSLKASIMLVRRLDSTPGR